MSVVQACADAQAAIARARSLFGATGGIDAPDSAAEITGAVQTATAGRDRTLDMAGGAGMPGYRDMVDRAIPPLTTASTSDAGLTRQLTTAAAVTSAGATRLDSVAAQTRTVSAAAPTARTAADQRAILTALRGQLQQAAQVVHTAQQQAGGVASEIRALQYPKGAPASTGDGVSPLDDDKKGDTKRNPLAPPPPDPPHGQDPRYWIDVTQIIHVPEGQLAPNGTRQIGPGLWYPWTDQQQFVTPPPPPARWPIDMKDIEHLPPGQLPQVGMTPLAPGWFTPTPHGHDVPGPWPPPRAPIDIRDIVHVGEGQKAPWGYTEYAPGWWAPDITQGGPR
jgi:Domain of unknown function (DUF4226)